MSNPMDRLPSVMFMANADFAIDLETRTVVKCRFADPKSYRVDIINGVVLVTWSGIGKPESEGGHDR